MAPKVVPLVKARVFLSWLCIVGDSPGFRASERFVAQWNGSLARCSRQFRRSERRNMCFKAKERAANVPAATLCQCEHLRQSWMLRRGRKVGRWSEVVSCNSLLTTVGSIWSGNGSRRQCVAALRCGCAKTDFRALSTSSCGQCFKLPFKFIFGDQIST